MTAKPPNTSTLTSDTQSETTALVTFDEARDSEDNLVNIGDTTFDKTLTFKGTAAPERDLWFRHDAARLTDVTSQPSGIWIKTVTLPDFKRYRLTVVEKNHDKDWSKPPYVIVVASKKPIIDKVIGENGEINNGDIYNGAWLRFEGFAPPDMEVEVVNGGDPTGNKIDVDADGYFKLLFDGFTAGTYKITIKAANGEESEVFEFIVASDVELILAWVYDSRGKVITEGTTTYDVRAEAHGDATTGKVVQLLNHGNPIDGAIGTAEDGSWKIEFELSPGPYSLTAKAGDETSKPPYLFEVEKDVKLSLDEVVGSKGPILEGETTYDRTVKICGYARPGKRVQLRNHDQLIGGAIKEADLDSGSWEIEIDVTPPLTYELTAEGLYDPHETTSPPRTFTVKEGVTLSLDDVLVSEDGPSVEEGETTDKSPLLIRGLAQPGESIQLRNNGEPIEGAIAIADLDDGVWKFLLHVTNGFYCLTARANYGDNEVTDPPRTFWVETMIQPHNTRVHDTHGLIDDGGTTPFTYVIVRGDGEPLAPIKLMINGVIDPEQEPEMTNDMGKWAIFVDNLVYGTTYEFIAVAGYGQNAKSNSWTITPERADP